MRIADHERGAWIQDLTTHGIDPGRTFQLVWGSRVIPFDADTTVSADRDGKVYVYHIQGLGTSSWARLLVNVGAYTFASDEERDEAMMLAAEALLVFGDYYDGLEQPEGKYRVEVERGGKSEIFTLASFGYEGLPNTRVANGEQTAE
jgi:hypothetical protein